MLVVQCIFDFYWTSFYFLIMLTTPAHVDVVRAAVDHLVADPETQWRNVKRHETRQPPVSAIFFPTHFYRGWGVPSLDPLLTPNAPML